MRDLSCVFLHDGRVVDSQLLLAESLPSLGETITLGFSTWRVVESDEESGVAALEHRSGPVPQPRAQAAERPAP